jgi:general secretion pathway protein B
MSFILDALKKSENERQRQLGPSLADIPVRRARTDRPWWAIVLAALLVVNLGVLTFVLLRDRSAPAVVQQAPIAQPVQTAPQVATQPAQTRTTAVPPPQATVAPNPVRTNPSVRSLAEVAGMDDGYEEEPPYHPSVASAANVPDRPPVVSRIEGPTVAPIANEPTFPARDRAGDSAPPDEMLPTLSSLLATGTHLPDMRLDIHVYSPRANERFVFVNMRKYTEGQTTSEGPTLERITPDGAVMSFNGTRFLLPRQ